MDHERINYARILVSTTSVEVLNKSVAILVDGKKYDIKLVEEWGCNLGEDAFLTEEVSEPCSHNADAASELNGGHGLEDLDGDVDGLINEIQREWRDHKAKAMSMSHDSADGKPKGTAGPANLTSAAAGVNSTEQHFDGVKISSATSVLPEEQELFKQQLVHDVAITTSAAVGDKVYEQHSEGIQNINSTLVPQKETVMLQQQLEQDVLQKKAHSRKVHSKERNNKVIGGFRHTLRNIKRIARMPTNEKKEILRILKRQAKDRKARSLARSSKSRTVDVAVPTKVSSITSNSSVNKDWEHWVALQGGTEAATADTSGIGTLLGVNYKRDKNNRFNVLSKECRRGLREEVGRILERGVRGEWERLLVVGLWVFVVGVVCCTMKIITYNVRGLGGFEKRSEVKRLVSDNKPFVLCLQETKLGVVDDMLVKTI